SGAERNLNRRAACPLKNAGLWSDRIAACNAAIPHWLLTSSSRHVGGSWWWERFIDMMLDGRKRFTEKNGTVEIRLYGCEWEISAMLRVDSPWSGSALGQVERGHGTLQLTLSWFQNPGSITFGLPLSVNPDYTVRLEDYNSDRTHHTGVPLSFAHDIREDTKLKRDNMEFFAISIVPTADEIHSNKPAFIRPSHIFQEESTEEARRRAYLENHFRLLREDMLYEIREELQLDKKRKQHRNIVVGKLRLARAHRSLDADENGHRKRGRWSIVLQRLTGLGQLYKMKSKEERIHWLQDNRQFLKHQSVACLLVDEELVALVTIDRDEEMLALFPPKLVVQIEGAASISRALLKLKTAHEVKLVQVNAPIFAYEPILDALKQMESLPFSKEILRWKKGMVPDELGVMPSRVLVNGPHSVTVLDTGSARYVKLSPGERLLTKYI
ncbi:10884_t:CDS:2, partial [Acaulospora colombiana]